MSLRLPPLFATLQPALIIATNILTLAVGPKHRIIQFAFSVPVLFLLAAQSLYREWHGGWGLQYGLDCFVVTNLAVWADWVLLNSPYKEGWVKLDHRRGTELSRDEKAGVMVENDATGFPKDDGGVVKSKRGFTKAGAGVSRGFLARLWWAVRLATTNRYTGWSCEVKNVPASVPSTYPRWKFLIRKTLRFALFYLLKDIIYSYTASSPHGTWLDLHPSTPVVGFTDFPFTHRLYWTWVYIALTYICLELFNTLYSLLAVCSFLTRPTDCPSMFADLRGAYTVRRAWSVVWHQQMRRVCTAPGIFLARDVLKLPRGSFASKYTQLLVGFAVSGAIHAGAAMLSHASREDDAAMWGFLAQAGIIFVEDHVIEMGRSLGVKDSFFWRCVGFAWVVLAIGASLQDWTGRCLGQGLWVHGRESDYLGLGPR